MLRKIFEFCEDYSNELFILLLISGLICAICAFTLTGCNYEVVDLQYNYDYAIIKLQDGTIVEGNVESWRDYEDGDQLQVRIDGTTYLTHSYNCTLMSSYNEGE